MTTIKIIKNGKEIKRFNCPKTMMQKYFELAVDIAGGMYNGVDAFKVIVE